TDVSLVFRHFPLAFHKNAALAAAAAECAGGQGKFWPMHDKLFENQKQLDRDHLAQLARELGLSDSHFDKCLASDATAARIARDVAEGKTSGVSGTPAFFINGRLLTGARPIDDFRDVIDEELAATTE